MAGALAWQVKKNLIKKRNFLVRGGRQHGDFFSPGSLPLCVLCVLLCLLFFCSFCSSKPAESQDNFGNTKENWFRLLKNLQGLKQFLSIRWLGVGITSGGSG
ncbi:hypothetical protein ABKV19_007180 [Rosa sericea]